MVMRSKMGFPFLIIVVFILISILLGGYYGWKNRRGFKNIYICKSLKPEISIKELIAALGSPIFRKVRNNNNVWLYFATPSIAAGLIRANVDESSDKVVVLRCFEDGSPSWELTKIK